MYDIYESGVQKKTVTPEIDIGHVQSHITCCSVYYLSSQKEIKREQTLSPLSVPRILSIKEDKKRHADNLSKYKLFVLSRTGCQI